MSNNFRQQQNPAQQRNPGPPVALKRIWNLEMVPGGGWVLSELEVPENAIRVVSATQPEIIEVQIAKLNDKIRRSRGTLAT